VNQTYDPILESITLKRWRTSAPRGPVMGTAIVLERSAGAPVVVTAGQRIPDAHTGNYTLLHRVDVANRGIGCTFVTPSADPAFPFTITVTCGCQVTDPVLVVHDGVRDMAGALQAWLVGQIRPISMRHDALRPSAAEQAITSALHGAYPPDGVRLSGFAVAVTTNDVAEIVTAQRELRVLEMRREGMRPVAHGGREEMLAHVMAMTDGDPTPMLDREQEAKENSTKASLLALSALMGSDKIEEFNTTRISDKVMSEFFPGDPLLGGKRPGIRDRIDRKRKAIEAPAIDAGVTPGTPADDRDATPRRPEKPSAESPGRPPGKADPRPADTAARPSRVRGLLRHEDG
jgi:hypothetical protein